MEGIREEVVTFSLHQLWRKGANGLWTKCRLFRHPMGGKAIRRKIPGHGGVVVCSTSHIIALVTLDGLPFQVFTGHNHVFDQP